MSTSKKSAVTACALLLAASFAASSALPSQNAKTTGKVPVNDYSAYIVKAPEKIYVDCFALTVGDEYIGVFPTADDAVVAVENAAYRQVSSEYEDYESYDIVTSFSIEPLSLSEEEFQSREVREITHLEINVNKLCVEQKTVPFSTSYVDDPSEYIGTEKIKTNGKDGLAEETYRVIYRDGEQIEREKISENVISDPQNKVVLRGTKYKKETQIFVFPYDGRITSQYGGRYLMGYTSHRGIDIAGLNHEKYDLYGQVERDECYGDNIHAAGDGKVIFAGYGSSYGYHVIIEHSNGLRTYYAHQSKILVKVGDNVKQGDVIGRIGNSGNSYGAHLHFEIRVPGSNGEYEDSVDPADYLIGYDYYPLDDK